MLESQRVTSLGGSGTFSGEKAAALAELGVTRASVGVQSLDDEQLQRCGRKHTAQEAKEAIRACLRMP